MSLDVHLAEKKIQDELEAIGITPCRVTIEHIDESTNSYLVAITSDAFYGNTYLDREMRVRPAITRVFSVLGYSRSYYVVEPRTTDEESTSQRSYLSSSEVSVEENVEEKINRAIWREQKASILRALEASHFTLEVLEEDTVYLASRMQLTTEKIVIGFAVSTNAKTVDRDVRRAMQTARDSQKLPPCYYISPEQLEEPFANQVNARWISLHTTYSFLHLINSSEELARKLKNKVETEFSSRPIEHRGKVVEPTVKYRASNTIGISFFDFVQEWMRKPKASLLVVMAPAGHGKTTITLETTRRLADTFLQSSIASKGLKYQPVPLWVPFESVRRVVDFESLISSRLTQLRPGAVGAFTELLKLGQASLLVDGFDELADDAGVDVAEAQVRSMRPLLQGNAKILLAGRSLFTQQFSGESSIADKMRGLLGDIDVDVVELLPFEDQQIGEYISTREGMSTLQKEVAKRFAFSTPDHYELCGNPLFLKIICTLAVSNKLPEPEKVAEGANLLIDRVCEREEERQHLGIGISGQLEFLTWIAEYLHKTGTPSVATLNIREAAETTIAVYNPGEERHKELIGRLVDHALLRDAKDGQITFIHPLIRDVILGRSIETQSRRRSLQDIVMLSHRDLPEGTVRYLSRQATSIITALPALWLTKANELSLQTRRNIFRIVSMNSRYRTEGNPRQWLISAWLKEKSINAMDFRGLILESLSFDGCQLNQCVFTDSFIDDCDFRAASFNSCTIINTTFHNCRGNDLTRFSESEIIDVLVQSNKQNTSHSTALTLKGSLIYSDFGGEASRELSVDALTVTESLATDILRQLVSPEPTPRFHTILMDSLQNIGRSDRERTAVEKVIKNIIINKMCVTGMMAGSKRTISLEKWWQRSVVDFLKTRTKTPALHEIISIAAAKAARYLN